MKIGKFFLFIFILALTSQLFAENNTENIQDKFKNYFNQISLQVKNETDPVKKRDILNNSLIKIDKLLSKVSSTPSIPEEDIKALNQIQKDIQSKNTELNGLNGFDKIKDNELNNYADYLVQDFEQADKYVTISITTLLLLAILLILLVKPF